MSKKIKYFRILLIIPIFFSCEKERIYSQSELETIIALSSLEDRALAGPLVEDVFNEIIFTPQPEKYFNIKWIEISKFKKYKKYPNLLLVSLKNPIDSTIDNYINRFQNDISSNNVVVIEDPFYGNQIMGIIHSTDLFQFEHSLTPNKSWFFNQFKNHMLVNMGNYVFSKGVNQELNNYIKEHYEYSINLQKDFKIIKEDKKNQFLWLGRGYPYRWLIFFEVQGEFIQSDNLEDWDLLLQYMHKFIPSIEISSHYRSFEIEPYNKKQYNLYRGVYSHNESQTGGPFFTYLLNDKESIIFISGFVNSPGREKLFILNQLEILAKTINKE